MTPEHQTRPEIDAEPLASGCVVHNFETFNPSAGHSVAPREATPNSGKCDYLVLMGRKASSLAERDKNQDMRTSLQISLRVNWKAGFGLSLT